MKLNLFENKDRKNDFINKFIEELRETIDKMENKNEKDNVLEEYNLYEKKKIFLDNKTRKGNELVWIMDENSICISENGDGGPMSRDKIDIPCNAQIGDVYEKINGEYIYNLEITTKLKEIK